jgi:hypothetical protein
MANQPNKKLLGSCKQKLQKYADSIHSDIDLKEQGDFFSMICNAPEYVSDERNGYLAARFRDLVNIWFTFSLKFDIQMETEKKYKYILTDANIKIFQINDQIRPLLFRAEFAKNKDGDNHAQPHWQFEPYLYKGFSENDFNTLLELTKEEIELTDNKPITVFNISKIHFSMTSNWHRSLTNKDNHIIEINEQNVVNWLDGCLGYIVEQMKLYS